MRTIEARQAAAAGSSRGEVVRRATDVAVSAALTILTLPVLVVVLVGSAVTLRAWPLFSQERIGRGGKPFKFVKVRTLPPGVPAYANKYELGQHETPKFCRLLRALHLDELPQLYLVITGHMSLIGPRPEMRNLHDKMSPTFAAERTAVRPGCTGLWQVSSACSGLIGAAPEYDRAYLHHRTGRLDAWILFRTALKMTRIGGHITLDDLPAWVFARAAFAPPQSSELRDAKQLTEPSAAPMAAGR